MYLYTSFSGNLIEYRYMFFCLQLCHHYSNPVTHSHTDSHTDFLLSSTSGQFETGNTKYLPSKNSHPSEVVERRLQSSWTPALSVPPAFLFIYWWPCVFCGLIQLNYWGSGGERNLMCHRSVDSCLMGCLVQLDVLCYTRIVLRHRY